MGELVAQEAGDKGYNNAVRPGFYLDLSDLFFAPGENSMFTDIYAPHQLKSPGAGADWNFTLFDQSLSLTMTGASTQVGESLTFQYSGTPG